MKYPLLGRPLKLTQQQIFQAIKLKHSQSSKQVANKFGVARSTLYRHIAKYKEAS
ncbi:helix-turn-helix domain-containing protein [Aliarcobacter cryaerophilus]|uniref:helix-turn-helix domain-containing protein n=1 Tax=Aliarcobacter cryaerophilus TaxID=28198 RepID=UPI003DA3B78B